MNKKWTVKSVALASVLAVGLVGFGATIGTTFGQAPMQQAGDKKKQVVKDDYKKHRKAFESKKYATKADKAGYVLVEGSNAPLAKGIMGAWVPDVEGTKSIGEKVQIAEMTITFTPESKPSEDLMKKILSEAAKAKEAAKGKGAEDPKLVQAAYNWSMATNRVLAFGKMELNIMNGAMKDTNDFVLVQFGDSTSVINFKSSTKRDELEFAGIAFRPTKDGKYDSLAVGEDGDVKLVMHRASETDAVKKARK